jgi:hypothetical protein
VLSSVALTSRVISRDVRATLEDVQSAKARPMCQSNEAEPGVTLQSVHTAVEARLPIPDVVRELILHSFTRM